jgi:glycosyltransferase involved in cell wall biosynthesis
VKTEFSPEITIVLSTYDRPDALQYTIESVQAQTIENWVLLVVGDACGPETEDVVAEFRDPRIKYVNLPERCGEQSGPNSVGLALADTDYIALLNHDDIWLPDHLEIGLDGLKRSSADLFVSRAAFSIKTPLETDRLTFTEISPPRRRLEEAFWRPFFYRTSQQLDADPTRGAAAGRVDVISGDVSYTPGKLVSQSLASAYETCRHRRDNGGEIANDARV